MKPEIRNMMFWLRYGLSGDLQLETGASIVPQPPTALWQGEESSISAVRRHLHGDERCFSSSAVVLCFHVLVQFLFTGLGAPSSVLPSTQAALLHRKAIENPPVVLCTHGKRTCIRKLRCGRQPRTFEPRMRRVRLFHKSEASMPRNIH